MLRFAPHRLRAAREHAGLKQEHVALALETSVAIVQRWERGDCSPRAETVAALAEIFDVPMSDFFERDADLAGAGR